MTKKNLFVKKMLVILVMLLTALSASAYGAEVEIPSSFNPVGSGARALGMGGAFIAVADDATAASWNPGGLTQLRLPEFSVVGSFYHRGEDIEFGTNPEADGSHSISDNNINYLSATYPFELSEKNMVVSLTYQHLYDFNREWAFLLQKNIDDEISDNYWDYQQTGSLTALGLSYCIRVVPQLSLGFTLNFWNDDLSPNSWEEKYRKTSSGTDEEMQFFENVSKNEEHVFSGFNFNLGFLWQINYKWTIGGVIKSPFKADIEHKFERKAELLYPLFDEKAVTEQNHVWDEEIKMPMSYGLGIVYNVSENFSISGDIYRTEWDDCVYKDYEGNETSPFTGRDTNESDISPTHQIRIGGEYRFIDKDKGYLIPIRAGVLYDPGPAEGNSDDFYGIAVGLGFTKNKWFSLDLAYQYRFGNEVGEALAKEFLFSEDVNEHMVYISMIWYKF
ncbi:OmpP1/FadL family transporter [Desulfonema magnum]|nr:outer membrane protein transport protein [Desulfonema magnum]